MRIGTYDNSHNRYKTRMDMRPQSDPAVQAGMRNIRRDSSGRAVGGITAEGERIGTAKNSWSTSPMGPGGGRPPVAGGGSLGRPNTPGLDRLAAMQPKKPTDFGVAYEAKKRQKDALVGGFGTGAQQAAKTKATNLAGRKALFAEMKGPDATGRSGEFRERARKLGVGDSGWKAGIARLEAPAAKPAPSWKTPTPPQLAAGQKPSTDIGFTTTAPSPGEIRKIIDLPDGYVSR